MIKKMFLTLLFIVVTFGSVFAIEDYSKLKILHLSFHNGCIKEIDAVAKKLSLNVETWCISSLPPKYFDGYSQGNVLYNIGHKRAKCIWDIHKDYFNKFDVIITSDTAPLSRIFLQNNWKKPLIIWICNRFDYYDGASLDCEFPDAEYYRLFKEAYHKKNVTIVAYNAFEHFYARRKNVYTGDLIITPCTPNIDPVYTSIIPKHIVKEDSFFLPPYHNENIFMNLSSFLSEIGIKNYGGRYSGPLDLKDFKAIIHLPYAWSTLAFFENTALGIPYFVPSQSFLEKLLNSGNYFFVNMNHLLNDKQYHLSEWYSPEHSEIITYFDSWTDLKQKLLSTDFVAMRQKIKRYAKSHQKTTIDKWNRIFSKILKDSES